LVEIYTMDPIGLVRQKEIGYKGFKVQRFRGSGVERVVMARTKKGVISC